MEMFNRFEGFQMDVLKEVGNIGAGNAATALSQLLNRPIDMGVPTVQMLPFEEVSEKVGGMNESSLLFSYVSKGKHQVICFL